ncbi:MAG: metallophosphoesterase [Solirubrobacterales bacterium]
MRALVISDTHFGAWTGRDLLREELFVERLAPVLEGANELIFLGDLFDFLFGSVGEAVDAADGLLRLIAEKLAAKRLVFLAGNHDHHLVHRDFENRIEASSRLGGHRCSAASRRRSRKLAHAHQPLADLNPRWRGDAGAAIVALRPVDDANRG